MAASTPRRTRRPRKSRQGIPSHPHDALFRYTFSQREHAASLLHAVLPPALAAAVDWRTLRIEKDSFVDDALRSRHSDLVLSARLRRATIYFYTLIEHQRDVEALMMLRMAGYMVRQWEQVARDAPTRKDLPVIVPILVHHSDTGWTGAIAFQDLVPVEPPLRPVLSPYIPHFQLRLIDLSEGQARLIVDEVLTPLARVALWCLSVAGDDERLEREIHLLRGALEEIVQAPNGHAALGALMRYIVATHRRLDVKKVGKLIETAGGPRTREAAMTYVDQFERRVERRGKRKGVLLGERKGRAKMLLRQMAARFGAVRPEIAARIEAADEGALDRWELRVLTAATPEEVVAAGGDEATQAGASRRRATRQAASKRRA